MDRKSDLDAERREVIRLFLAMLCLDTQQDADEISRMLHIEDPSAMWELAKRAQQSIA